MPTVGEFEAETVFPVVIADAQGVITHINEPFIEAFGWTREEIIGSLLSAIMPPKFRDSHHLGLSRFLTTQNATVLDQPLHLEVLTKTGEVVNAEHLIIAERREQAWVFAARIKPL